MTSLNLDLNSFHDYDIRGIYPSEINEEFFYHLGKSIARYINASPIAIGHDMRLSSESLTRSLIEGITDQGIDVVDLGMISTEMHNYASGKYKYPANVIITASHNPGEYNGAKILKSGVVALHGSFGLPEIKAFMNEALPVSDTKGKVEKKDIFDEFIENCISRVNVYNFKRLKVVVDAANGMGGPAWQRVSEILKDKIEIIPLYLNPDGTFPNHIADPLKPENTIDIKNKILETGADLGIALDGDADRVFFVDNKGVVLSGTMTTALFCENLLKHGEKGAYLYNVNVGRVVPEIIKKYGGEPYRIRVGHSYIKAKMHELNAVFAGEHSCHFFFRDNYGAESSLLAGLLMIQLVSESGKTLSELREEHDIYPHSGELNFKVEDKQKVLDEMKKTFSSEVTSTDEIDGITFWFENWWFIIRLSKTEPVMRLNMEADNSEILSKNLERVVKVILDNGGIKK